MLDNLLYSIKIDSKNEIKVNTRLLLFLLGAFAETFLLSFVNNLNSKNKPYFTNEEIKIISELKTQEERWKKNLITNIMN